MSTKSPKPKSPFSQKEQLFADSFLFGPLTVAASVNLREWGTVSRFRIALLSKLFRQSFLLILVAIGRVR
jgi:hypothetical protein